LQGGRVPSWQTTVVLLELAGTTTVVFAGGGGLLLLMHPASMDALSNKLEMIFIDASW
jgi:shikimate kinase